MKVNRIFILVFLVTLFSCSYSSPKEREIIDTINKSLDLSMIMNIRQGDRFLSYEDFRRRFKYISVVNLKKGCQPCYSKFKEWQNKMDSININDNSTLLFIINAESYEDFLKEVTVGDNFKDRYYTVIDPKYIYNYRNRNIPKWIINSGILIDQDNKIKLIGAPYSNVEMTKLYHEICSL